MTQIQWQGKRYWLVGASEGLGRALAHRMSAEGVDLVVSARSRKRLDALVDELPGRAQAVECDVSSRSSCEAAVAQAGHVDGIVFLAGLYWPMSATEWDAQKAEAMADVNFTGALRSIGAVMPQFLERGEGHVVIVGSLSGFRGLPKAIGYGASKAACMYLAESMRVDLQGSGVRVQVANPGFVRTRLTDKNAFAMPFIMEPEEAAEALWKHINSRAFKANFPWLFSLLFRCSQFWPDWLYFRVFR